MPVLEKNIDHESNRDLEREKDRDREGKDREKGPKTKSSTKGMSYRLVISSSTYAVSFVSQGSLSCALQVLQGRLLYRRGLVSLFPRK
jgi:hypothetical protein